jgi:hypothetical protein
MATLMQEFSSETRTGFYGMQEATAFAHAGLRGSSDMSTLLTWIESYLMASHPELGRTGSVCPFTKQAAKMDTVRLAISHADPTSTQEAFALVRAAFAVLNDIPACKRMEHFRTVIIGFPAFGGDVGIAALKGIQRSHRFYSLARGRMIGLMHRTSEDPGLWNPDFRPLRSPMPVLAVRHMVEQDAPFAAMHPALALAYVSRFPFKGLRRLAGVWRGNLV